MLIVARRRNSQSNNGKRQPMTAVCVGAVALAMGYFFQCQGSSWSI
jgi:hypothetical protein